MKKKPKLGQNFLADPSAAQAIVEALGDISRKTVLEIGPGTAAITRILAARAQRLVAVELDRELAPRLRSQFEQQANVEVIERDILHVDFATLVIAPEKLVVVGNLPYYMTSDILLRILEFHGAVSQAVIMVQREVADRVSAEPGTSDYGLLSATAQMYARVETLFTLPPEAFVPPPKVYSSVLRLTMQPRAEALGVNPAEFVGFLRKAFAQKRKTLANNLRAAGYVTEQISIALEQAGVPAQARAEALPLETAAQLYRSLTLVSKRKGPPQV
jgi:16S rRNA (adenine1518-N6/adenine1519-N6)-dimethyltransferase